MQKSDTVRLGKWLARSPLSTAEAFSKVDSSMIYFWESLCDPSS